MIIDDRIEWSSLKTHNVTVTVRPQESRTAAVFIVSNLIDLGNGRQTVILDNVLYPYDECFESRRGQLAMPEKLGRLNFVYTGKKYAFESNIYRVIRERYDRASIERIIPDVLAPGDYLVFKKSDDRKQATIVEALRAVTEKTYKKYKGKNAL